MISRRVVVAACSVFALMALGLVEPAAATAAPQASNRFTSQANHLGNSSTATSSGTTVINFDDLPVFDCESGTSNAVQVTNQYPSATFSSSDPSEPLTDGYCEPDPAPNGSLPNAITTGSGTGSDNTGNSPDLFVTFTNPVSDLTFTIFSCGIGGTVAQVDVTGLNNQLLATVPVVLGAGCFGDGGYGQVDLSAYTDVTSIHVYDINNPLNPSAGAPCNCAGLDFDNFSFTTGPVVTGVTPGSGPPKGGNAVSIQGSGFSGATSVLFGNTAATFTVNSGSSISATAPTTQNLGKVDIVVSGPNGTSQINPNDVYDYASHYVVTLRAWIPQPQVVDPYIPNTIPWIGALTSPLAAVQLAACPRPSALTDRVQAAFAGDNHSQFDGTYRAEASIAFDWDGSQFFNVQSPLEASFGTTVLTIQYLHGGQVSGGCTLSGTATSSVKASASGNELDLSVLASNPLIGTAPPIDGEVSGTVGPDGSLDLTYGVGFFPSFGLKIIRDGAIAATDLLNDVSCLSNRQVLGPRGLANLSIGLTSINQDGTVELGPNTTGQSFDTLSRLC